MTNCRNWNLRLASSMIHTSVSWAAHRFLAACLYSRLLIMSRCLSLSPLSHASTNTSTGHGLLISSLAMQSSSCSRSILCQLWARIMGMAGRSRHSGWATCRGRHACGCRHHSHYSRRSGSARPSAFAIAHMGDSKVALLHSAFLERS